MSKETIKEVTSGTVGGLVGGSAGVAGSTALVASLGVPGLSAPGIVSGLAAVGLFNTGMLGGLIILTGGTALLAIGGVGAGLAIQNLSRK